MNTVPNGEKIGSFEIQSGMIRVSDPCYEKYTWCAGTIEKVKNGNWEAYVKYNKNRVSELIAIYDDISKDVLKKSNWLEEDVEIGVDSGQCGIFDLKFYPDTEDEEFYEECCNLTNNMAGVLDFGAVSRTGWGDGSYVCYTLNDKEVVGVKVVFIDEYETDDYSDDYMEYDDNNIYPDEDDIY
jgi:hypothetical protein